MKKILQAAFVSALLFGSSSLVAQQVTPPATKDVQATPAPMPTPEQFDKTMAQMLEQMKTMQAQMEKIRQSQDPQARQKLLQEHWTSMQNAMATLYGIGGPMSGRGMTGPSMMGGGPMMVGRTRGPMMWGDYRNLNTDQLKQRQYMMGQYMGVQQMMMDHMMWHQYWTTAQSPAAPK